MERPQSLQRLLCGVGLIAQEICTAAMVSRLRFGAEDSPVAVEYVILRSHQEFPGHNELVGAPYLTLPSDATTSSLHNGTLPWSTMKRNIKQDEDQEDCLDRNYVNNMGWLLSCYAVKSVFLIVSIFIIISYFAIQ